MKPFENEFHTENSVFLYDFSFTPTVFHLFFAKHQARKHRSVLCFVCLLILARHVSKRILLQWRFHDFRVHPKSPELGTSKAFKLMGDGFLYQVSWDVQKVFVNFSDTKNRILRFCRTLRVLIGHPVSMVSFTVVSLLFQLPAVR